MTDSKLEELIEQTGGFWVDDEFRINGKELMALLRAAGASEGQAFEQWLKGPHDGNFNDQNHRLTPSERVAAYRAWKARDAEIAALHERIAALEALEPRHVCPNWPCCPCERREDCTVWSSGA